MNKKFETGLYLCERVMQLCKEVDMAPEEFADKIGRSENFIYQIKSGRRQPGANTINKICTAFKISPNYFFEDHSLEGLPRGAAQVANDYSRLTQKNKKLVTELIHALLPKNTLPC